MMNSLSVEALQEIVEHCQHNEERLRRLARRTRHERKKVEQFLRETKFNSSSNGKWENVTPKSSHRVRFNLDQNRTYGDNEDQRHKYDKELADLARRCESLLSYLHHHYDTQRIQSTTKIRMDEDFEDNICQRVDIQEKLLRLRLKQHALFPGHER